MTGPLARIRDLAGGRNAVLLLDTATTALTTMVLVVGAARRLNATDLTHFSLVQLVTVTTVGMVRAALYSPALAAQRNTGPRRIPFTWLVSVGLPLSIAVSLALGPFVESGHMHAWHWIELMLFCIVSNVAQDGARTVLVSRQSERLALVSDCVVFVGIAAGWLYGLPSNLTRLLLYWGTIGLIGLVVALAFILWTGTPTEMRPQTLRATWRLARWASVDILLASVATLLPYFVSSTALSSNSAGVYRTLQTALGPLNIVHTTVVTAFGLDAWRTADLLGLQGLRKTVSRLTAILAIGGLAYSAVAEFAMVRISDLHDGSLWRIALIMMVAATLGAANSAYNAAALALGFQRSGAILRAVIVVTTIVISLPQSARTWVPWHDPIGVAAITSAIATFAGWALSYSIGSRAELARLERSET